MAHCKRFTKVQLYEIILEEFEKDDSHGICHVIETLHIRNEEVYPSIIEHLVNDFNKRHNPNEHESKESFWWHRFDRESRINFLEKIIENEK